MQDNFDSVMRVIFSSEGGYVNHPKDPGGATNMGITHKTLAAWRGSTVSRQDVRDLTKKEASDIYRAKYWDSVLGDDLPYGVDLMVMDRAVHSGPRNSIKALQNALGVSVDGSLGPVSLGAAERCDKHKVVDLLYLNRLAFLKRLRHWKTFGKGWNRRMDKTRHKALQMIP